MNTKSLISIESSRKYPGIIRYQERARYTPCLSCAEQSVLVALTWIVADDGTSDVAIMTIADAAKLCYGATIAALRSCGKRGFLTSTPNRYLSIGLGKRNKVSSYVLHLPAVRHGDTADCEHCISMIKATEDRSANMTDTSKGLAKTTKETNRIANVALENAQRSADKDAKQEADFIAASASLLALCAAATVKRGRPPTEAQTNAAYNLQFGEDHGNAKTRKAFYYHCLNAHRAKMKANAVARAKRKVDEAADKVARKEVREAKKTARMLPVVLVTSPIAIALEVPISAPANDVAPVTLPNAIDCGSSNSFAPVYVAVTVEEALAAAHKWQDRRDHDYMAFYDKRTGIAILAAPGSTWTRQAIKKTADELDAERASLELEEFDGDEEPTVAECRALSYRIRRNPTADDIEEDHAYALGCREDRQAARSKAA